ncbi:SDR family NAD(P)-dependent oxidoreductase [Hymenobacter coccineus]|uniref:Short-chain dehydrogenase n=1 Tax=Hymenobacter coccineus TaxID=1908235 RepID=A0A1G1T8W5_9BACT|nr:SDR family NAD(P)-dependent oxidoreductase [Hymenobacter coccineus]OGX87312.1 short-chain dehydrogenase [Hymenobacter coccineus]
MKTALITGANKGIGFETARQLLQHGYHVYLGSRDAQRGQQAADHLRAAGYPHVTPIQLDVADSASIAAARAAVGQQTPVLDVLVNNAGISGGYPQPALDTPLSTFREVFNTNVFGPIEVTHAFRDLLRQSPAPRIVNVSSGLGSLTLQNDPSWRFYSVKGGIYPPSKTALNAYTVALAYELRDTPFKVNLVCPGYVDTDFTDHLGDSSVTGAATRVTNVALLGPDGPTGQFFGQEAGSDLNPW